MRFACMWILGLSCVLLGGCGKSDKEKLLESYQEMDERRHQQEKEMAEYREKKNELSKQYQAGKIGSFNPSSPEFKSLTIDQQALLTKYMPSVLLNPLFNITISARELPALDAKLVSLIQKDLEASAERSTTKDYLKLRKYIEYDRKPTEFNEKLSYEEREKQDKLAEQKFADTFAPHQQIFEKMELTSPEKVQLWLQMHVKSTAEFQTMITALQKLYAKQALTESEKTLLQENTLTSRTYKKLGKG